MTSVAAGLAVCVVLDDRTLHCSGPSSAAPTSRLDQGPQLADVVAVDLSFQYGCALLGDGTVQCWGSTETLGRGEGPPPGPVTAVAGLSDVVELHVGGSGFACARRRDATLWCWGNDDRGQLGDGATKGRATPVQPRGVAAVTTFAAGETDVVAVLADGSVSTWGTTRTYRQQHEHTRLVPAPVPGLHDAVQVGTTSGHACARVKDGTLWCWGDNEDGQLGDGTTTSRAAPVRVVGQTGVTGFALRGDDSCALHGDGSVACWGDDVNGIAGCGTRATLRRFDGGLMPDSHRMVRSWAKDCLEPTVIAGLEGVAHVDLDAGRACALVGSGAVRCWGHLASSGDPDFAETAVDPALPKRPTLVDPVPVSAKNDRYPGIPVASLAVGDRASCVVATDGRAYCDSNPPGVPLTW